MLGTNTKGTNCTAIQKGVGGVFEVCAIWISNSRNNHNLKTPKICCSVQDSSSLSSFKAVPWPRMVNHLISLCLFPCIEYYKYPQLVALLLCCLLIGLWAVSKIWILISTFFLTIFNFSVLDFKLLKVGI